MAKYIETSIKICETCKNTFQRRARSGIKRWNNVRFCSSRCRGQQKFSAESLQKKIDGLKPYQNNRKGKKPWNWIEDRTKIKISNRNFHDPNYKQWHKSVKDRDSWKCRIADNNCAGRLEAHHILPWSKFPELRYETNNGITLCHAHHPRKREDEAKLSPFFQQLVAEMH